MSNSAQDPNASEQLKSADTPMDTSDAVGKGKAPHQDTMDEDDDEESSEEETGEGDHEEAAEDNMEEIDMDNIVGSRTRGKNIDYAEAAKQLPEDDEDDENDDDFQDEESADVDEEMQG